ncbi:phosphocarrier protein HPr [Anaerobacillus alkalilacustris]|uniref:Phosphocarrier protein HPr n=1 Tax=Anaerobacillus alkalilacustris TaxID=393763 RepID=A0A1S2LH54_9BACI|nr:phosphocarrier protein HPr [Anaerobacillus alkalilacustris]OIJ11550.1 phosphocarrier protein HPr [Anaerobacillus alkalilacustris]
MVEKIYTITSESGIHARPATLLVNKVTPFSSEVKLEYKGKQVNLKSIMGVMSLGIPQGETIKIIAQGDDEEHVLSTIDEMMKTEGLGV